MEREDAPAGICSGTASDAPSPIDTTGGGPERPPKVSTLLVELVRAAEDGDRTSFDRAFDACLEHVYGIAWTFLRDRGRAEEITENILLAAVIENVDAQPVRRRRRRRSG